MDLGTLRGKIKIEVDEAKKRLSDTKSKMDEFADSVKDGVDKAKSGFSNFASTLSALGVGQIINSIVDSVKNLASEAMNNVDALKKFETTMSFAGYDSKTIKQAKKDMKEYADKTVYSLEDISSTTAQLGAAGIQDFEGLTEAAGNLNAVAGGSADTFSTMSQVLTQTAGAGKLTTENWRQLTEAIPGASGVLKQALQENGAYVGNFEEAMSNGEISAEEFFQAIQQLGEADGAKKAATDASTFEGAFGNLEATVTDGIQKIIDAIGMENITGFINGVSDAIEKAKPYIDDFIDAFKNDFLPMMERLAPAIVGVIAAFDTFLRLSAIVGIVQSIKDAIAKWKAANEGLTISQWLLNAAMAANPFVLIATLIAGVVAALAVLYIQNETFRTAVNEAWGNIKQTAMDVWGRIVQFFTVDIPNAIQNMQTWFANLPSNIANVFNNIKNTVANWVSDMGSKATKAAADFGRNLINGIKSLPSKVVEIGRNIIQGLVNGITGAAGRVVSAITGAVGNAIGAAKKLLGIASPSKLFKKFGGYTMEGFEIGIEKSVPDTVNAMRSAVNAISGAFTIPQAAPALATAGTTYNFNVNGVNVASGSSKEEIAAAITNELLDLERLARI